MIKKTIFLFLLFAAFVSPAFAQEQQENSDFGFDQYYDQYIYEDQGQYYRDDQGYSPQQQLPQPRAVQPRAAQPAAAQSQNISARPYFALKGAFSGVLASFDLGGYYDSWTGDYYSFSDDSSDIAFTGLASLGVKLANFRMELEYSQRTKVSQTFGYFPPISQSFRSYMVNFLYESSPAINSLTVYGGIGFGATHVKNDLPRAKNSEKDMFSLSFDFGVSHTLTKHLNLDAGMKIWYLGSMTEYRSEYLSMSAIDFYLGLRYTV
ncbi:MAG: porin family protein [Endomicrobia bacterium]|nr:porin family protein [Endomicrobiia bacterium]